MRIIADFHIHSRYSRACSPRLTIPNLALWAQVKGINLMGTGDFTHPLWFREIEAYLQEDGGGFLRLKQPLTSDQTVALPKDSTPPRFVLTSEIANIFSQGGRVRKMHNLIVVSSLAAARRVNIALANVGNLASDGRPILGLSAERLVQIVLESDPQALVIPAHAWTPWFSVFGSKSGFDSLEEAFGKMRSSIYAIETGLSSDPEMNWRLSALDRITLVSCSDAHSLENLGREATVFDLPKLDYPSVYEAIKNKDSAKLPFTIEFFPEEGKYHLDGHADCKVSMEPAQSKAVAKRCPVCKKSLTIGVLHRVLDLADRPDGFRPTGFPASRHIIPLREIIGQALGKNKTSVATTQEYWRMIAALGSEFGILLDRREAELTRSALPRVASAILKMRAGRVKAIAGYDGVFGIVKVLEGDEENRQASIF